MDVVLQRAWEWFQRRPKHPALLTNEDFFFVFNQNRPIERCDFVVLDTELTGLNPRRDEIVSIGAVRIRDMRIMVDENFYTCVRTRKALPKESTLIHRITSERVKTAPSLDEVLPDFVEFCGTALLVGHYVQLDLAFLSRATRKVLGGVMHNPSVDCARLARAYAANLHRTGQRRMSLDSTYQLPKLASEYGLPLFAQHDALEDAMQTAYLFVFLAAKLQEHGLSTFRDFCRASEIGLGDEELL